MRRVWLADAENRHPEIVYETAVQSLTTKRIALKQALSEIEMQALSLDLEQARRRTDEARASLLAVRAEIVRVTAEKDRMLAKVQNADVRERLRQQIAELSIDTEIKTLDSIREQINRLS